MLAGWKARHAAFIGAWNPGSRRMPLGWNRRMDLALHAWLRWVPHRDGAGIGRGWSEDHALAALHPARAAVLARRFRQAAIVLVAPGRPARLCVLPKP